MRLFYSAFTVLLTGELVHFNHQFALQFPQRFIRVTDETMRFGNQNNLLYDPDIMLQYENHPGNFKKYFNLVVQNCVLFESMLSTYFSRHY
jgi:hypothetical protein